MSNQKIRIGFSDEDLDELRRGRTHNWCFSTKSGEMIDVELYSEEEED